MYNIIYLDHHFYAHMTHLRVSSLTSVAGPSPFIRSPTEVLQCIACSLTRSRSSRPSHRIPLHLQMPAAFLGKGAVICTLRLALRPLPRYSHQLIPQKDDLSVDCDDNYRPQAPSVKNELYSEGHRNTPAPTASTLLLPHGSVAMSLSPPRSSLRPHEIHDLDTNIYPALNHSVAAPACRLSKVPHLPLIPPSSPVMQSSPTQVQQMMLPRTPHHSPYDRPLLPHRKFQTQVAGPQKSQAVDHLAQAMDVEFYPRPNEPAAQRGSQAGSVTAITITAAGRPSPFTNLCNSGTGLNPTPPIHAHTQPIF